MPNSDRTGPHGQGSGTGRGQGRCKKGKDEKRPGRGMMGRRTVQGQEKTNSRNNRGNR